MWCHICVKMLMGSTVVKILASFVIYCRICDGLLGCQSMIFLRHKKSTLNSVPDTTLGFKFGACCKFSGFA
ncbi:hypothetical protein VIGAN_08037700 [Vigna angularis var. angularis]|uniref:Uncharacterized protein n=1 Tax=Vigna angularis var. angularis TaxID=157739 RepID=A0A0S3SLW0_PHAAN|nr:hypothetical protein VIGAN_08037700 [Vigna angularis var. angularis]